MTVRRWRGSGKQRGPREVWSDWTAADEAGDTGTATALAAEMLHVAPGSFYAWYHAALLSKALGRWAESLERNARAVELFTPAEAEDFDGVNPAAWNLGIAATALGDWATARRAWEAYGIQGMGSGLEAIDVDFGLAPVRLNPDQPSLPHQVLPSAGTTEVVWCWRRSPAHAVIANVPLPESGHRFRDVLLHDGEPKGFRKLGGQDVAVFDQLERLEDSGVPTWQAQVTGATPDDLRELSALLEERGLGVDDWSAMRMLCAECSRGTPDAAHNHAPAPSGVNRLGLAGPESELDRGLNDWLAPRPAVHLDLALLW
ncbi:tetratricopeptide repeat protein [Pseudarthrobacter sp. NamE2]|uniref:tetratricopeptide repeat protein n=1 Tax=Pseudarthrobacter sp. NamE2 TaxID=2576838 RepID=UPI0010FD71CC|nr:tetratricopeptide repeat protein [Pseudarthrobacter sp. NamE2]TLM82708.1 tetratricopeptide repeat protein [Pseudarthrobacter sp. NamE2]